MSESKSETVEIWNRPAKIEKRFSTTVRVRWQDNGTRGYIAIAEVDD